MNDENENHQHKPIPAFEGHPVNATAIKMSGAITLDDLDGEVVYMDDVVQMISQFRCVGVRHEVDKNGEITRVQILRPMEAYLYPFDPSDPNDTGVLRATPQGKVVQALPSAGGSDE